MACEARSRFQNTNASSAVTPSPQAFPMRTCLEMTAWQCNSWRSCIVSNLRGGRGSLHLNKKWQQTPTKLRRGNARISFVSDSYLEWRAVRKCTVISYNLQKRIMSRKQEETSLTPAIWRKKTIFTHSLSNKGDARWLFLRVLCVYYWQAGWKMKGLVVMEICSRDAHGASEAMPHKSTYALHLPRGMKLSQNFSAWHFILHLFSLIGSSMNSDLRAPGWLSLARNILTWQEATLNMHETVAY